MVSYFISYKFFDDTSHGFGNLQFDADNPICHIDDLKAIVEIIKEGNQKIIILNWQRFDEPAKSVDMQEKIIAILKKYELPVIECHQRAVYDDHYKSVANEIESLFKNERGKWKV